MEQHRELERVEEENRILCDRLATFEDELSRRDDSLGELNAKNKELIENLKRNQQRIKELEKCIEESEAVEYQSRGSFKAIYILVNCCFR